MNTASSPLRVISLGWGVQSWTLAAMAALGELEPVDYAIHADTTHEMQGTYAHAAKWTGWLERRGVKVITLQGKRTDVVMPWGKTRAAVLIPAFTRGAKTRGVIRRQCTGAWKIQPIRRFIRSVIGRPQPGSVQCIQGISWDEAMRVRTSDVAYIENVYPLVERRITRADCILWLESKGLDVPPKSSCSFCPYHQLIEWKRLKRGGGFDWEHALAVDREIREIRRHQGWGLYVHPARRPLAEAVTIPEDSGMAQMEMEIEKPCDSGFCFT